MYYQYVAPRMRLLFKAQTNNKHSFLTLLFFIKWTYILMDGCFRILDPPDIIYCILHGKTSENLNI